MIPGKIRKLIYHNTPQLLPSREKAKNLCYAKIQQHGQTISVQGTVEIAQEQFNAPNQQTQAIAEWGIHMEMEGNEEVLIEAI